MGTYWTDTSHYQTDQNNRPVLIDDSYPHQLYCFRTNNGDEEDRVARQTAARVLDMLNRGKLKGCIIYYFFRPGQANCDLHKQILVDTGLWQHPKTVTMVDVEDDNGVIRGDQSAEVNDEVARLQGWYGLDKRRVIGYLNAVSNAGLWRSIPTGMRFVTPNYSFKPGVWAQNPPPQWMKDLAFAQQYTDRNICPPWPKGTDHNYSGLELPQLLELLGIGDKVMDPIEQGAAQLRWFPDKIRQVLEPKWFNKSTKSPAEPWTYDMLADIFNNVAWDGFTLPTKEEWDKFNAEAKHSLVGWVLANVKLTLEMKAQLNRIEEMLTDR